MTLIVFDLDGTLIDSLPDVTAAANGLLAEEALPSLSTATVAGFVGLGEKVFLERLIASTQLEPSDFDRLMERFIEHYKIVTVQTRLFPGALDALQALRGRGHRLALCTNKPLAALTPTLKAAGLNDVFDVVVAGDTLPVRKPDPAPVRHILSRLGAASCIYVGDSETDAETAVRASIPFVLFTEGIRQSPVEDIPHAAAFGDFRELSSICERLVARVSG